LAAPENNAGLFFNNRRFIIIIGIFPDYYVDKFRLDMIKSQNIIG